MTPVDVRSQLVDALRLDLVGPDTARGLGIPDEILPQPSSAEVGPTGDSAMPAGDWQRTPREARVELTLPDRALATGEVDVPDSRGLRIAWAVRGVPPEACAVWTAPSGRSASPTCRTAMLSNSPRDTAWRPKRNSGALAMTIRRGGGWRRLASY